MANLCCSIETEPRTLNEGQLNYAREVAVDIVQKLAPDKASRILTEGLIPVASVKEMEHKVAKEGDQIQSLVESKDNANNNINGKLCQCACISSIIESPEDQAMLREPVSAPF